MSRHLFTGATVVAMVLSSAAFARPLDILVPAERDDTTGFVGFSIPFAANPQVRVTLGLRQATVGSAGDIAGGEFRLSFDPWSLGGVQIRALALRGTVDHAGLLGGGWDFATGKPFASFGVSVPHLSGTADMGLDGSSPQFAVGLDSLGKVTPPDPVIAPPGDGCGGLTGPGVQVLGC